MRSLRRPIAALLAATACAHAAPDFARDVRPLLEELCLDCHDDSRNPKGDLNLERFTDEAAVMRDRHVWKNVFDQLEAHMMPPPKREQQPTTGQRAQLLTWIREMLARPEPTLGARDPGKPVLRRLTRLEYNNAIRDLFALPMDVFMFPERLPFGDKSYFQPGSGRMADTVRVPLREYGGKYPVLCRQLGLPGDSRAEHGFTNRGDAMDFSPLLLEKYVTAAHEIVHAPELPMRSAVFADLIGAPPVTQTAPGSDDRAGSRLVAEFAPAIERAVKPEKSPDYIQDFRRMIADAHADGRGGVFDVPAAMANQTIAGKGGLIKAAFGSRTLTINPNADLWLASFATATASSSPALITNREKGAKLFELTLGVDGGEDDEGVERVGVCVLGRKGQKGEVKLTAVFSDGTDTSITAMIAEGPAGTTNYSFAAHPGETIRKLVVDGSGFSGDYVLLDDIGVVTSGKPQPLTAAAPSAAAPPPAPREVLPPRARLADFLARAFRREVAEAEVDRFFALYEDARRQQRTEADSMRSTLAAVLASPTFLFIEANGRPGATGVAPLDDAELATRLALFLWASTPDQELLALARRGELTRPETLAAQTQRMLSDAKVRELSESFATQWLRLDQLYASKPDARLFPAFYTGPQGKDTAHGSMLVEALLHFETVLVENRSNLELIDPGWGYLNPRLLKLYGLQSPDAGDSESDAKPSTRETKQQAREAAVQWTRTALPDKTRGGVMHMGATLTLTSLPFRTSPVKRGAWLLETIFNRPPLEPKVAFVLKDEKTADAQPMSVRERFEAHRSKAECYSCHIRLDPPGFALEAFSPIGTVRVRDGDVAVDARGEWNGRAFDGPAGFKAAVMARPEEFVRGFIEHLLSYAIGRKLEYFDMASVDEIQRAAAADAYRFRTIITAIVQSYPFRHCRNDPAPTASLR